MRDGERRRVADTPLLRQGEHRGVIDEILERHDRLQYTFQIISADKPYIPNPPHGVDVEGDAALPELESRHLAAREAADQLLIDVAERDLGWPEALDGGAHGLGLEDEHDDLGFFGAEAEGECVPGVVREDGEVGGEVRRGGGERRARGRESEEAEELEGAGTADGEGFDDELAAEAEAFHVGGRLEGEIGGGGLCGLVVRVLVLLLFVFILRFFFLHEAAAEGGEG